MSLYGSIVRGEGLKYQETRCGNGGVWMKNINLMQ